MRFYEIQELKISLNVFIKLSSISFFVRSRIGMPPSFFEILLTMHLGYFPDFV